MILDFARRDRSAVFLREWRRGSILRHLLLASVLQCEWKQDAVRADHNQGMEERRPWYIGCLMH
jgi:hypothetical protein